MSEVGAFLWLGLIAAAPLIGAVLFGLAFLIALVGRRLRWRWAVLAIPMGIVVAALTIFLVTGFFMRGSALPGLLQ